MVMEMITLVMAVVMLVPVDTVRGDGGGYGIGGSWN
jgi:hypothetical protein